MDTSTIIILVMVIIGIILLILGLYFYNKYSGKIAPAPAWTLVLVGIGTLLLVGGIFWLIFKESNKELSALS